MVVYFLQDHHFSFYFLVSMNRYSIVLINFVLILAFNTLFNSVANAVEVKNLYQASVQVNSQASVHRRAAIKAALRSVLVKVGGQKTVLTHKTLKKAVVNYNLYITQYRYQRQGEQLFLLASYNAEKINLLFQQANLPLWGGLRPQVLLWLIDEQGLSRTILSNSSNSTLPQVVSDFSKERGLPIIMPLMDFTDASQISLSDIWGRFEQPIREASNRYFAEAIVVMRISNSSLLPAVLVEDESENETDEGEVDCGLLCAKLSTAQEFVLDWSLITQGQKFTQQYQGGEHHGAAQETLLKQGLADITELIYQRYALSTSVDNDFIIDVVNVDSLVTYTEVFNFLSDLSAVSSVTLVSAKGELRRFSLELLGSQSALISSLKLNKQLRQYVDPLADMNNDSGTKLVPVFYWK